MGFAMWLRLATLQGEPAKTWRGCDPADRLFPDALAKPAQVCCEPVAEAAQRKFGPDARSDLAGLKSSVTNTDHPFQGKSCGSNPSPVDALPRLVPGLQHIGGQISFQECGGAEVPDDTATRL